MKTLAQLYQEHHDKVSDKWSLYLSEYDRVLAPYRSQPIDLLEIGVQNGGSLEIWAKFFERAQHLVGCDINPLCANLKYDDPRVAIVVGDANLHETELAIELHVSRFDVVIDDGSHRSGDIVRSFMRYFPRVKDGGVFIVEDLHCGYWQEFEGGLYHPYSSITFFKQLVDVINSEHWGIEKNPGVFLQKFSDEYGYDINAEVLRTIHSIEFINSLCVIRKESATANLLGPRIIAGSDASTTPEVVSARCQEAIKIVPSQVANTWSTLGGSPAELWPGMIDEVAKRNEELNELQTSFCEQVSRIAELSDELAKATEEVNRSEGRVAELRLMAERLDSRMVPLHSKNAVLKATNAALEKELAQLRKKMKLLDEQIARDRSDMQSVLSSTSWRLTAPVRWPKVKLTQARSLLGRISAGGGVRVALRKAYGVYRREGMTGVKARIQWMRAGAPGTLANQGYREWIRRYDQLDDAERELVRQKIASFVHQPVISVVMPVYNPKPQWLADAIESVRNQLYPKWELCVADDLSPNPAIRTLLERYAREDERIKVVFRTENGHISAASNSALDAATGEWVALLDHDDLLPEHALYCVADAINEHPSVRLIYSDEDKINEAGERCDPYFKSAWNPDLFYSHNMFSHLGVYKKTLLSEIGGFRIGYEGSQDYDLMLRCLDHVCTDEIYHIPRVLYHWRIHAESTSSGAEAKPYAAIAGEKAINEHFARRGVKGTVEYIGYGYRAHYALPDGPPLVSLIIPTRNAVDLIQRCIDSILEKTTYSNYEIIIVDNGSDDADTLRYLHALASESRIRVLRDDSPFNYSALNNRAVQQANGEIIALLNNDIEVISPEWLSEMVSLAIQPEIGAVGARLLYPDDTIQHAGLVLGILGVAGNVHKHTPRSTKGYFGRASLINDFSAVTAACMVVRKSIYEEVGGLNEADLTVAYNDVDFCLRIREAGYRNVWTPYAELYHHESATRGNEDDDPVKQARFMREFNYMRQRWETKLQDDDCYNPNLTLDRDDFSLAWPPRVKPLV